MKSETFVSSEQAKALKECGFDWKCQFYYTQEDAPKGEAWFTANVARLDYNNMHDNEGNLINYVYSAPTQALAQKWMRDVHGLHICVDAAIGEEEWQFLLRRICDSIESSGFGFDTYESALSAGLDAALELIKQK